MFYFSKKVRKCCLEIRFGIPVFLCRRQGKIDLMFSGYAVLVRNINISVKIINTITLLSFPPTYCCTNFWLFDYTVSIMRINKSIIFSIPSAIFSSSVAISVTRTAADDNRCDIGTIGELDYEVLVTVNLLKNRWLRAIKRKVIL